MPRRSQSAKKANKGNEHVVQWGKSGVAEAEGRRHAGEVRGVRRVEADRPRCHDDPVR